MSTIHDAPPPQRPPDRWPWQRSLQTRMAIAFGGAFLLILTLLTFWLGRTVYSTYLEAAAHDLELAAFLAANALEDPLSGYGKEFEQYQQWEAETHSSDESHSDDSHDERDEEQRDDERKHTTTPIPVRPDPSEIVLPRLQSVADIYAGDAGARVTILDGNGHPVADSEHAVALIGEQSGYAEVTSALYGGELTSIRMDDFTGVPTLFAAAPIQQGSEILGIVQLSKPMQAVSENAQSLLITIALAGLVAVLASIVLAFWISRQLVRPVVQLERAALAAAGGDLTPQVPVQTSDELGALAHAFNYMVGEVRTMLDRQRAFVANASHELRTPLTNIKLRIEAVRTLGQESPDVSARYLAEIESEADRLARLANALLDLSHLEGRQIKPAEQAVDLAPVLHDVADIMQLRAQQAGIALEVDAPPALTPVKVYPDQVEEAVINLLDNAIKYTPAGGKVMLSTRVQDRTLVISVADTGPGIPPEDLPYIFDRFYRVDKVRSRARGAKTSLGSGAGLGLSIAKQLVEQNQGSLQVESAANTGTTFVVSFPLMA